ncbi:phosphate ABC transporter substrate-binding/OmpA family protein [Candidatus Entotheonella palauensis]|uniref:phosphate ABC transporter substrate-binding/OmpA family protein n=1 Tax=Candidatus Entotheonella palauensis TaxID=93172 RepID=UPI000B7EF546|nr:phosphate ABC transporter substrate-binding/OmpA family protein [Candidatus Entotheonella palauensis]
MNKRVMGALAFVVVGIVAVVALRLARPYLQDAHQRQTSDAQSTLGRVTIAVDSWVGYVPLCSAEMKQRLRQAGWLLQCQDDHADYAKRMQRLRDGEIDFAVATVDAYLLNAAPLDFPGVMVAVIDESKGGDAIVARHDRVESLDDLKGQSGLNVALTPNSPSHHLARAAAAHFDVPELLPQGPGRIETDGSAAALKKLMSGKADVAVLWEPDVSRAVAQPDLVKLLGTEDTARLIVDILMVNRRFSQAQPEVVSLVLSSYFKVLKGFRDQPETLHRAMVTATGLPQSSVEAMLKGVAWTNLTENCRQWFGIAAPGETAADGLIGTIEATNRILSQHGEAVPLPDGDPYRLIRSQYLEDLYLQGLAGTVTDRQSTGIVQSLEAPFTPLDDAGWQALRPIGTLKVEPIIFQRSAAELSFIEQRKLDDAVARLQHYPNFRVVLKGHTGLRGDPHANAELSKQRAARVAEYLMSQYRVDPNRLRVMGMGGREPLPRGAGEPERAYNIRLSRVEFLLVTEVY